MSIIINGTQTIDEEKQWVFMTISVGNEEIKYTHVAPLNLKDKELQDFVNAREEKYRLDILKDTYPQSDHLRFQEDGKTELEVMKEWVTKGHKNKIRIGQTAAGNPKYGYEIIEKQKLEYKHPKWIGLLAKIESSNVTKEMKDLLKQIVK